MHIGVDVMSSDPRSGEPPLRSTHCIIVFVALDEDGRPTPVPRFVPAIDEGQRLEAYALHIAELRGTLGAERDRFVARIEPEVPPD